MTRLSLRARHLGVDKAVLRRQVGRLGAAVYGEVRLARLGE
jgi:hypothetical protein